MQAEGGRTIERRSGTRAATTFRKLPSARAGAKTKAAATAFTLAVSAEGRGALAAEHLGIAGDREDGFVAGHPGRDDCERWKRGVRRLPKDDRSTVERAVDERGGSDLDVVRRVDRGLRVRADELR